MNITIQTGNVGNDVKLEKTNEGNSIVKISIAVRHWNGNENITNWFNWASFGKQAEFIADCVKKGDKVTLKGKCVPRRYQTNEGVDVVNYNSFLLEEIEIGKKAEGKPQQKDDIVESAPIIDIDTDDLPFY